MESKSPEEIAAIISNRESSERSAVNNGAEYVMDPGADKPRLEFPQKLVELIDKEGPDTDPVYLREGKEVWQERVHNYLYNVQDYKGKNAKYPFDYTSDFERSWRAEHEQEDKPNDRLQQLAEAIDNGFSSAGHGFTKIVPGILSRLEWQMSSHNVPENIVKSIKEKYHNQVDSVNEFIINHQIINGQGEFIGETIDKAEEYRKELEGRFPDLVPTDKSVHEINPLIKPFIQVLSELKDDELPKSLIRSAHRAGISVISGVTVPKIDQFLEEAAQIPELQTLRAEIQALRVNVLANYTIM